MNKLFSGGKYSRDKSPLSGMRDIFLQDDNNQNKNRREATETKKTRDKTRDGEMAGLREGEIEWRDGERRQVHGRGKHGRPLSTAERTQTEQAVEKGKKKGDTFPRERKGDRDPSRRMMEEEGREMRQRDRLRRELMDYGEMERWRRQEREREETQSRAIEEGRRPPEDIRTQKRERYKVSGVEFQERTVEVDDSWDRRDRDAGRKREKLRAVMDMREAERYSPQRRPEREMYTERRERTPRRDARSEGDVDEKELERREKMRDRGREEGIPFSRSDEYYKSRMPRNRDRGGYQERYREERYREERYKRREKDDWERNRDGRTEVRLVEREREGRRKIESDGRRDDDRYRNERRERESKKRQEDGRAGRRNRSLSDSSPRVPPRGQSSEGDSEIRYRRDFERDQRQEGSVAKEPQIDPGQAGEKSQRQLARSERLGREETTSCVSDKTRMWLEPHRGRTRPKQKEGRRVDERDIKSQGEGERDALRLQGDLDERNITQSRERQLERRDQSEDSEGVSVDGDEEDETFFEGKEQLSDSGGSRGEERSGRRDFQGEDLLNNTRESGTEEEGGSDSGGGGGSDGIWNPDRDRMLFTEDSNVILSSGGDDGDEREQNCRNHEKFCKPGTLNKREEESPAGREEVNNLEQQGREKKFIFCVVGQTSSRSETSEVSLSQDEENGGAATDDPNIESHHRSSDEDTHKPQHDLPPTPSRRDEQLFLDSQGTGNGCGTPRGEGLTSGNPTEGDFGYGAPVDLQDKEVEEIMKKEPLPNDMEAKKRDSQTERLLEHWRENNKREGNQTSGIPTISCTDFPPRSSLDQIQPFLNEINTQAMIPEEAEAIRIRKSKAGSDSKVTKRRSEAPHLKWATSVVREILGHSGEQTEDEPNSEMEENQSAMQAENNRHQEEAECKSVNLPVVTLTTDDQQSEPEQEDEEEDYDLDYKGTLQNQGNMHADQVTIMNVVTRTCTHSDTLLNTGGKEDDMVEHRTEAAQSGKADLAQLDETAEEMSREKKVDMYLNVSCTLYKPSSCPILNYNSESVLLTFPGEGERQEVKDEMGQRVEESLGDEMVDIREVTVKSSYSFQDSSPEIRLRRMGIRKTRERQNRDNVVVEGEEEEGVGRDRRTRIFPPTDDNDIRSKSWGEVDLKNVLNSLGRRTRKSSFYNRPQLYQQYNEEKQNFEILRQSRSDNLSVCEVNSRSPLPSPPLARRPLPPVPSVPHPHSLSHTGSVNCAQTLPLPEQSRGERRASSPSLSLSLTQSSLLWRDLPAVRNSPKLEKLTEDQRRLQEVRFEVVTSEASYSRSLDIVVEHFVKCKELEKLLTTQDKNWLFSRLTEVRAISHRFLAKLEERVESDVTHFTVCDIIAQQCQRFKKVYVPYLTNQSYQDATYQRLMNDNPNFKRIVESLEKSSVCQRLPLRSFLVLPFQRITRIKLLVQNILKRTTPGTVEAENTIKALRRLERIIQESSDSIAEMKTIESLVSLSGKVEFVECKTLPLISQKRRLVREGPVTELMDFSLKHTERTIYLHLFNDHLLVSLQKEGGRFTVIDHCPVDELRTEDFRVKLLTLQKNSFRLHMSQRSLLLRTETQSDKQRWLSALSRTHPVVDFSAAEKKAQMQCIRAYVAQQPDELSVEKADVILVHQDSADNWVEGTRLSDLHCGWVPKSHLKVISNDVIKKRNLSDALTLTKATAAF